MTEATELAGIIERCQTGDELAWEYLVRQFQGRVYGMAFHFLGDREEARDITQEVFIRVYQNITSISDAQGFFPWVLRITRNACIDHSRRRKARPPISDMELGDVLDLRHPGNTPEEEWIAGTRKMMVCRALQQMTALNREIIILKDIQGLQLEEIAAMLGVPLGTVKSRSNRARIELAEKLLALTGARTPAHQPS